MIQDCKFDSSFDLQETVPMMSTDLLNALETGVVMDTGTVGEFNDIQDPTGVWCRVTDAFQAMDIQRTLRANTLKASAASGAAAVSSAASTSLEGKTE